ncbi:MAG: hypothetical protein AAAFM81_11115 [Pseudomonadota bacterium]
MHLSAALIAILSDLRFAGGVTDSTAKIHKNGLSQVQFGIEKTNDGAHIYRYQALGSPRLIGAAEYFARAMTDGTVPSVDACIEALDLSRQAASEVLLVEEAARNAMTATK